MPTAIPAMKGIFGTTEYYLVTMRARELADKLVIPKELDDWEDMTLEERFQREVNYNRVKKHIAPYLAHDPDRFFGAFIVDIYNDEGVEFEPIGDIIAKLPALYKSAAQVFGFLNFQGGEVLVPLDGQHRLAAIRFAITGKDEKGKDIVGLSPNLDVANDYCTVILVRHDTNKARKIFNKVNRYAKATSKADNLITADDDIVAVITREEVADKVIHEKLVNYESNTLPPKSAYFTTLSTLYEATLIVLEEAFGKIDKMSLPSPADQKLYRQEANGFWTELCQRVKLFENALHDPSEAGDEKRREIRADYVLGKPIVQLALVDAVVRLRGEREDGTRFSWNVVGERLNLVDWRADNPLWQGVLMSGEKVVTGKQSARFAGRFLAYYLGDVLTQKEVDILRDQYTGHPGNEGKVLPTPIS
jgi:DNA sulfur modification protein DndB